MAVGPASPLLALQGLWAYDGHWALETALQGDEQSGGDAYRPGTGQVTADGSPLDDRLGHEEAFGFQTLAGKPFYFFKRQGKIDANYDGVDVALSYDEIAHYNCCTESSYNPNLVTFLGRRGDAWSYGVIGVFDQP